ncbi:MFS transporter [Chromohalobacter israelensis]|uniref:MFS transporter n=1 Tax=Chromohalobacter israelensis TaxID=141390 RepID=UPI000555FF79|nr:MFS transporter [Chromohalobacter israelensis]MDF9433390.1 MFS transporter [Chromohalobacter israelensis]
MPIVIIAIAEWFGTALWFTPNAVIDDLQRTWGLATGDLGWLTGAVQFGFLLGTLGLGLSGLADRTRASRLFALACLVGALSNALLPYAGGLWPAVGLRLITGLSLAGIYPIGMKLMVGWAPGRAGLGLAWLVGMLVLGTAMPHLLAGIDWGGDWKLTLWIASLLALLAGVAVWRLGDAPCLARVPTSTSSRLAGLAAFGIADFRRAASAYFGHMWELYTLWTLIPLLLIAANPSLSPQALSLLSFALIAVGAPGCWLGGWLSQHLGSRRVAILGLAGSAIGCLLYPWIAPQVGFAALVVYLAAWSLLAVIDSPQFSALSANACPATLVGSALTLQNAIGFAISAVSIGLLVPWLSALGATIAWWLLPGPLLGLLALRRLGRPARVEP